MRSGPGAGLNRCKAKGQKNRNHRSHIAGKKKIPNNSSPKTRLFTEDMLLMAKYQEWQWESREQ